jgi:hypothetical protein
MFKGSATLCEFSRRVWPHVLLEAVVAFSAVTG